MEERNNTDIQEVVAQVMERMDPWEGPTDVTFEVTTFEDTHKGKDKPTLWIRFELNVHGRREKIESPVNAKAVHDLSKQLGLISKGLRMGQLVSAKGSEAKR